MLQSTTYRGQMEGCTGARAVVTIDIHGLSIDELEDLRDACSQRILEMRRTRGLSLPDLLRLLEEVKVVLHDQSKEWHSLERWQWMDGEIRFWLNPRDQELYNTGWFSIDDLIAWSRERGPVLVDQGDQHEDEWDLPTEPHMYDPDFMRVN